MNQIMSILDPVFRYIDSGKLFRLPFQILYYLIGVLCAIGSIWGIARVFELAKYMEGIAYLYAILATVVFLIAGALSVIYWFRKAKFVNWDVPENARFLAIPSVAGLIITFGEWLGLVGAFVMFCLGMLTAVILPFAVRYNPGGEFLAGLGMAILGPIFSYIALVFYRFIGEMILAVGNIANDTRRIAERA